MRVPLAPNIWEEGLLFMRVSKVTGQLEHPLLGHGARSDNLNPLPSQIYAKTAQEPIARRFEMKKGEAELNTRERAIQELEEQAK